MRPTLRGPLGSSLLLGSALTLGAAAHASPPAACGSAPLASSAELVQCIQQPALMGRLTDLQAISDANPGPDGHGNRDTGQPGYKASVDYVSALMQQAGYKVTVQSYPYTAFQVQDGARLASGGHAFALGHDWHVARLSGSGAVDAPVQAAHGGCAAADFAGFVAGRVALVERGGCDLDDKVALAEAAHAAALIVYNPAGAAPQALAKGEGAPGAAFHANLQREARIPVVGVASDAVGRELLRPAPAGGAPAVQLEIHAQATAGTDYNLIADSPLGDPTSVVVVEGHLDSIYGAGILDNGSGSASILEVALAMAKTPTRHQLRYIWFGGEEIGIFGSAYYTKHLTQAQRAKIVFDIDADVTATPNYTVNIADPGHANNVSRFPANVVPDSKRGNQYFADYFASIGVPSKPASFGNSGTDSNSFALIGIPNTGVLTEQDCCKTKTEVKLWGGSTGNYEGKVPGRDGGCVDRPRVWCDDIHNINPTVFEFVSQAVAYVTWQLANDPGIDRARE